MRRFVSLFLTAVLLLQLTACAAAYRIPNTQDTVPTQSEEQTLPPETTPPTEPEPTEPEPTEPPETEPPESTAPENISIVLTFAGDCMLASYKGVGAFSLKAQEKDWTWFFDGVAEYFWDDDFTIVNLENVLTDDSSLPETEKDHDPAYWFKAPTANTNILTSQSVEAVSVANNHTWDYGYKGYMDTLAACTEAGLLCGTEGETVYLEKDGFRIALICCGLWGEGQVAGIIKRVQQAQTQSDFQIVYYHGGTEGIHTPEEWKIRASRQIADAGADLVIGNHPHVLQPYELYNGVPIIYSMGNFCYGGSYYPENRTILYRLSLEVDALTLEVVDKSDQIIPCYVYGNLEGPNNYQPRVIEDIEAKEKVLEFMYYWTESPLS